MIGVAITVRDQGEFLGEALDSVAAQTLTPTDVVVVDDGSRDGSGDLARARGVRTVRTPGLGVGAARNAGVKALDTPLIAFLDADDRLRPGHHAALSQALAGAPQSVAAFGQAVEFLDPRRLAQLEARFAARTTPHRAQLVGAGLIRREAFDAVGGFDESGAQHEVFTLLAALSPTIAVDELVLERRIHGQNMTIVHRDALHARYLASARAAILQRRSGG